MATEALKKPMLEGSGDIVKKKQQKRLVLATTHARKGFIQLRLEKFGRKLVRTPDKPCGANHLATQECWLRLNPAL